MISLTTQMLTRLMPVVAVLSVAACTPSPTDARPQEGDSPESLTKLSWPLYDEVSGSSDERSMTPSSITLSAMATPLNVEVTGEDANPLPYTDEPLDACVSALNALLATDPDAYSEIAATPAERNPDGSVPEDFVPDTGQNLYQFFTMFEQVPSIPKPAGASIEAYVRVGDLHGFYADWSYEQPPEGVADHRAFLIAVEEFAPGKFRIAPKWMHPDHKVQYGLHGIARGEADEAAGDSGRHELTVTGLYSESNDDYPLTLSFAGGLGDESELAARILKRSEAANAQIVEINSLEKVDAIESHPAWKGLETYFTRASLDLLQRNYDLSGNIPLAYPERIEFVLDGGEIVYVYSQLAPDIGTFSTFVRVGDEIKLDNFGYQTSTVQFLKYEPIASALRNFFESEPTA
jgi:hypothetical protein